MKLVIDASVFFTALIGTGVSKKIIFSNFVELYCPVHLFNELEEHKSRISKLSGLPSNKFDLLVGILKSKIEAVPEVEFERFLKRANELISDKDDTAYLSLSLAFNKIPIWSNDPHFKQQSAVSVFNTFELVRKLKSLGYSFE